jgi:hypothetical protein
VAELKTKKTEASVEDFINKITDEEMRRDCFEITKMMKQATRSDPKMWGSSIIGFGSRHLKYASGRELDWMLTGFSPRKGSITLYILSGFDKQTALLQKLGKHSTGKGCLYIKKLKDVDAKVLTQLINESVQSAKTSDK